MKVTELVTEFSKPIVEEMGCSLWDVEYVREGPERFLRIYIDKEGGVDIEDCEKVHRALDPVLDEKDPIVESYHFEVCSAGLERTLRTAEHFAAFMDADVLVKLYRPKDGTKEFAGVLKAYNDGDVTIDYHGTELTFEKSEVALVRLRIDF